LAVKRAIKLLKQNY